jgi:hypothetical protein
MENQLQQIPAEEPLPWHKPEVQRLVINIDTQNEGGSGQDLVNGENP